MTNKYSTAFSPASSKQQPLQGEAQTIYAPKMPSYRRLSLNHQLSVIFFLAVGDIAILAFALFLAATATPALAFIIALSMAGYAFVWGRQILKTPATHATYRILRQTWHRLPLLVMPIATFLLLNGVSFASVVLFITTICCGILAWRTMAGHALNTTAFAQFLQERLLLIGDYKDIVHLLAKSQQRHTHTHLVGYYSLKQESASAIDGVPSLGMLSDVAFLRSEHPIDAIVVVGNALDNKKQRLVLRKLAAFSCPIYRCLMPVFDTDALPINNRHLLSSIFAPAHVALLRNRTLSLREQYLKRTFDVIVSGAALVALSPLLIAASIAVKVNSKGAVFFRQQRWGINGKVFHIYKFRSMYQHSCDNGQGNVIQAKKRDARITPVGCILRSTSIDELPQLFNVLKGDMSLIGPRPHAVGHNEYYAPKIPHYISRHRVKPGLSGLAQVHGYRGETPKLEQMHKRVSYDAAYIRQWSVWLDIQIVFRTLGLVLRRKNAY